MTWIKEKYDRFILALLAAALAGCAVLLFLRARDFSEIFAGIQGRVVEKHDIKGVDMATLSSDSTKLADPFVWHLRQDKNNRPLPTFVSPPLIEKGTPEGNGFTYELVDPYQGDVVHPPIPNKWLIDNKQDMLASNVLTQDSDGDGFTTLDEYLGGTDPNEKNSHPPYYTKLFLGKFVRVPFRLRFEARNGNVMLINTIDADAPTQFRRVGDMIEGTKFKITKLDIKSANVGGIVKDVSEATLFNTETKENIVLTKEKDVDSPTTYADLNYLWNGGDIGARKTIRVLEGQEFTIPPENDKKYKVLSLSETEVVVLKEDDNKQITIKPQSK